MTDFVNRIVSTPAGVIAGLIVLLVGLWFLFHLLKLILEGGGKLSDGVFYIIRQVMREVAGPDVKPYERLNGILIICLTLLSALCVLVLFAQSVRAAIFGESPQSSIIAAFLFCVCLTLASGVVCVRLCARHHADLEAARNVAERSKM